ncbi:hydroxymethylglutaryl-CoA lyase [Ferruginibacter paludis]|uniref:hydroxymethylglutaryl-CoA lyase n=1 Tax=Ferruginibacter paludis TaxID=1310417 RepID=UPI0025B33CB7|nr:hydroxymethylglutaryl-CoA lyase [Ferruginibacter paludis]MDN3654888.1 hydroxymethylglutaryl-CoA lyase [Ferruginibacter paludis]
MNIASPVIQLIECPRDAMQGWPHFIPTHKKIQYLNALLRVGFNTIDFGSFVSHKAIPQMADTEQVIRGLNSDGSKTKLLAIVANTRGAQDAMVHNAITYLGFPFSISPTFQLRNTNSSMEQSLQTVEEIQNLCIKNQKKLVIYISMGFGNLYGDPYNESIVMQWLETMTAMDISIISIADTIGIATPQQVGSILKTVIPAYPDTTIGVHLHSTTHNWKAKLDAALQAGCRRFDGALKGIGGCPMAGDELVGNMDTALMIPCFNQLNLLNNLNEQALSECIDIANEIFV